MQKITQRQSDVLDFIERFIYKNDYPPTLQEIAKEIGVLSSSTVFNHLKALEKKGYIERLTTSPRAIKLKQNNRFQVTVKNLTFQEMNKLKQDLLSKGYALNSK